MFNNYTACFISKLSLLFNNFLFRIFPRVRESITRRTKTLFILIFLFLLISPVLLKNNVFAIENTVPKLAFNKQEPFFKIIYPSDGDVVKKGKIPVRIEYSARSIEFDSRNNKKVVFIGQIKTIVVYINDKSVVVGQVNDKHSGILDTVVDVSNYAPGEKISIKAVAYDWDISRLLDINKRFEKRNLPQVQLPKPLLTTAIKIITIAETENFFHSIKEDQIGEGEDGFTHSKNTIVILLKDGATSETANEIANLIGGKVVGNIPSINLYQIMVDYSLYKDETIFKIKDNQLVDDAYFDVLLQSFSLNDLSKLKETSPSFVQAYSRIQLFEAWNALDNFSYPINPVGIGIIDSGIDKNHPEFKYITLNADAPEPFGPEDKKYHGTSVAGIIGAGNMMVEEGEYKYPQMNGILSGIPGMFMQDKKKYKYSLQVMPFFGSSETAYYIDVLANNKLIKIINMSAGAKCVNHITLCKKFVDAGGGPQNTFRRSINAHKDILFVVAAGNEDDNAAYTSPANINGDNIITVGATNLLDHRAVWSSNNSASNYGDSVDISAPGVFIYTPQHYSEPLDIDDYYSSSSGCSYPERPGLCFFGGTSGATPLVSGVAGMLFAIDSTMTPQRAKAILTNPNNTDPVVTDPDKPIGRRLNALKAVQAVLGTLTPTPPQQTSNFIVSDTQTQWSDNGVWKSVVDAWRHPGWPSLTGATWIWKTYKVTQEEAVDGVTVEFRRLFTLPDNMSGTITVYADNGVEVFLNNILVKKLLCFDAGSASMRQECTISYPLEGKSGQNELRFVVTSTPREQGSSPEINPAGLAFRAEF